MKALIEGNWYGNLEDHPGLRDQFDAMEKDSFRSMVELDAQAKHPAQKGRYHLYVSYACPFAHRTILARELLGLKEIVGMSVADPRWSGPDGWLFDDGSEPMWDDTTIDHIAGERMLYRVYQKANPNFTGRVTVPVLWDTLLQTIVSNESAEIVRMFGTAFGEFSDPSVNLYPSALQADIDSLNGDIRARINGGVYACGFARDQESYDKAVGRLFDMLDQLETRLGSGQPYLFGDRLTESDLLLFCSLVRFDAVYFSRLKCSRKRLVEYPALAKHTRRIYELPGIADTVRFDHIKRHYFDDLGMENPTIQPADPDTDFRAVA